MCKQGLQFWVSNLRYLQGPDFQEVLITYNSSWSEGEFHSESQAQLVSKVGQNQTTKNILPILQNWPCNELCHAGIELFLFLWQSPEDIGAILDLKFPFLVSISMICIVFNWSLKGREKGHKLLYKSFCELFYCNSRKQLKTVIIIKLWQTFS